MANKNVERNHGKHRLFNIWKKNPSEQAHTSFRYQRNLIIGCLKTAQNRFCKQFLNELSTNKEQWSIINKKIGKERECLVLDTPVDAEREVEHELGIGNCLNRSFQKLGSYNEQIVNAPNTSRKEIKEKFCVRTVTLKELYDAFISLDNIKSPSPGIFIDWEIKASNFAIGTHSQFAFNLRISQYIFPENLRLAFISPAQKKRYKNL